MVISMVCNQSFPPRADNNRSRINRVEARQGLMLFILEWIARNKLIAGITTVQERSHPFCIHICIRVIIFIQPSLSSAKYQSLLSTHKSYYLPSINSLGLRYLLFPTGNDSLTFSCLVCLALPCLAFLPSSISIIVESNRNNSVRSRQLYSQTSYLLPSTHPFQQHQNEIILTSSFLI